MWRLPFWLPPGCSLIYAGLLGLGCTVSRIIPLQQGLGVLTAALVYAVGRLYFPAASRWRSALAALLFSCCPAILYYETKLLKPVWLLLLLFGALIALRCTRPGVRGVLTGVLVAALALVESYFIVLLPLFAWFARARTAMLGMLIACAILLAPVIAANSMAAGRPMFVSSNAGINLYLGNNRAWVETYNTLPGWRWSVLVMQHGQPSHDAAVRFLRGVAEYARTEPAAFLSGLAAKALATISCRELPRDSGFLTPRALLPLAYGLNAAAMAGLVLLFAHRAGDRGRRELLWICGAILLVNVVFFPTTRYRLPLLPLAFLGLAHAAGPRSLRVGALAAAASVAAGFLVPRWVDYDAWEGFREKEIGMRCMAEGRAEDAGRHFETAVGITRRLETLETLAHYRREVDGNPSAAYALWAECMVLEPRCPEPYFYAAMIDLQQGRRPEAGRKLERYLAWRTFHQYGETVDSGTLAAARYFHARLASAETNDAPHPPFFPAPPR